MQGWQVSRRSGNGWNETRGHGSSHASGREFGALGVRIPDLGLERVRHPTGRATGGAVAQGTGRGRPKRRRGGGRCRENGIVFEIRAPRAGRHTALLCITRVVGFVIGGNKGRGAAGAIVETDIAVIGIVDSVGGTAGFDVARIGYVGAQIVKLVLLESQPAIR